MKKAVIVGGSNGIGLAISSLLIREGYFVDILDINDVDEGVLPDGAYRYTYFNMLFPEELLIRKLAEDKDVKLLMITAGIGRVADFQFHHTAEIEKMLTIDTVSTIKILRMFYDRILSGDRFYTGVMGSISGWLSSPSASVYSAAKAGVVRFIESVNIELEMNGSPNRILDVSPSAFKGSRFYGGKNDLSLLTELAEEILKKLFSGECRYIPQYEEIFKGVIERYQKDPHEYGIHSYEYKKNSGRQDNEKRVIIGYLSGTFDLFHIGHLNLLKRARMQCDYLIVGVHDNGKWKGKETFIPLEERKAIVAACRYVDRVVDSPVEDSEAWELYHFDRLFVGSDYQGTERFARYEQELSKKGVKIVYFPYTKTTSSTQLRDTISKSLEDKASE